MLTLDSITLRLGGHLVLDKASASLPPNAHVGLVGRNGAGKSTLLKVIAGVYEADEGSVETPSGTRIGYVAQEAPGGTATPFETVLAAATERAELLAEAEHAHDPHRIGEIHERLTHDRRAWRAGARFPHSGRPRLPRGATAPAARRFSGGWRMRVALAALLFSEPELLLLDEPSNHLDLEAAVWLESFLRSYRGSLIVVSHERDLLNNVVDYILHLERGGLTLYHGNYDSFARQRTERTAQTEAQRGKQEAKAKKLQAYVDRWRYKAHTARQAQSRLKALAAMEPIAAAVQDAPSRSTFRAPRSSSRRSSCWMRSRSATRPACRCCPDSISASIPTTAWRWSAATATARRPWRGYWPVSSSRWRARSWPRANCRSAISPSTRSRSWCRTRRRSSTCSACCRGLLPARCGRSSAGSAFPATRPMIEVRQLSGGERARLSLALITRDAPHILILDEPTNHLDIEARDALVEALAGFGGAVVVVSHDRHLLGLIADRLLLVDGGTASSFDGTLDDYRDLVLGSGPAAGADGRKSAKPDNREARPASVRRGARAPSGLAQAGLASRGGTEPAMAAARRDRPDARRAAGQWRTVGQRADENAGRGRAPPGERRASLARGERGRRTRPRRPVSARIAGG